MSSVNGFWYWIVSIVLKLLSFLKLYHPPLQHFLPGQLIYYVAHQDTLSDEQVASLIAWSNGLAAGADISSRRTITLPAAPPVESQERQPHEDTKPQDFSENKALDALSNKLTLIFATVAETANLVKVINLLYEKRQTQPVPGINLELVAPHWLITGGAHLPSTGGPGSWPVEAEPPHDKAPAIRIWQGNTAMNFSPAAGANVHVAILDTLPAQHVLDHAYHERHWHHPLIDKMLNPSSRLIDLCPAKFEDLHESADFSVLRHGYMMRDHGLFIAGLIYGLAPHAKLHMYEALNPFGVGTIESIANCLEIILNDSHLRPVVINCSFTLGVPGNGTFDPSIPVDLQDPALTVEKLFALCNRDKVIVVAAAGNDSSWLHPRQPARYPAAFEHIFGVGALQKADPGSRVNPASYSNMADRQPSEGYVTLGGEHGAEQGLMGMYLDDFPELSLLWRILNWLSGVSPEHVRYRRNITGWAWWAGTSFAAAILSGTLAALPDRPGFESALDNFREAQRALNRLAQPPQTVQGGTVIRAEQA